MDYPMSETSFKKLLDRPIAFHRCYVDVCKGSVSAALFLSQAVFWNFRATLPDGWFWKTSEEWQKETGLSRRRQDSAREKLKSLGVLEDELRGSPPQVHYKVNMGVLMMLIGDSESVQDCENVQIELAKNAKSNCAKTPNPYNVSENTTKTTAETTGQKPEKLDSEVSEKATPYFPAFRTRWRAATGVGCPKGAKEDEFAAAYIEACTAYGEDEVLSMVDAYGVENAEWIKKYHATPKKFFEELAEIAEARRIVKERKSADIPWHENPRFNLGRK